MHGEIKAHHEHCKKINEPVKKRNSKALKRQSFLRVELLSRAIDEHNVFVSRASLLQQRRLLVKVFNSK